MRAAVLLALGLAFTASGALAQTDPAPAGGGTRIDALRQDLGRAVGAALEPLAPPEGEAGEGSDATPEETASEAAPATDQADAAPEEDAAETAAPAAQAGDDAPAPDAATEAPPAQNADGTDPSPREATPSQGNGAASAAASEAAPPDGPVDIAPAAEQRRVPATGDVAPLVDADGAPRNLVIGILADARPFSSLGRFGVRVGFDVDVTLALCARLEVRCDLRAMPPADLAQALSDGTVDAVVAALGAATPSGGAAIYTRPYVQLAVRFVIPESVATDQEAGGSEVYGALLGTAQASYLEATYRRDEVRLYPTAAELWIELALGRVTSALAPAISARREFLSTPMGEGFRFSPTSPSEARLVRNVSIAVSGSEEALANALDRELAAFVESTDYRTILRNHLDRDLARAPDLST